MKIELLQNAGGMSQSHSKGDVIDLEKTKAEAWIKNGMAKRVKEPKQTEAPEAAVPEATKEDPIKVERTVRQAPEASVSRKQAENGGK